MTKVNITSSNNTISLVAIDHATGSQQVCTAISTLLYTLEGWLINNPASNKNHSSQMKDGYAFIEYEMLDEKCKAVTSAVVFGLMQIENSFPEYIQTRIDSNVIKLMA